MCAHVRAGMFSSFMTKSFSSHHQTAQCHQQHPKPPPSFPKHRTSWAGHRNELQPDQGSLLSPSPQALAFSKTGWCWENQQTLVLLLLVNIRPI